MSNIDAFIAPARKETLVDVIHNRIIEIIIEEDVSPEIVLTEGRLVQQFNVSKATVREALVRLCNENILKSIPRYGFMIVHMGQKEHKDICRFRLLMEGTAVRESFDEIAGGRQLLEDILERHKEDKVCSVWDVWQKNMEFHEALISFSHNQIYLECLRRVMQRQALYFAQDKWRTQKTFSDLMDSMPHTLIVSEIRAGALEKVLEVLRKDICGI